MMKKVLIVAAVLLTTQLHAQTLSSKTLLDIAACNNYNCVLEKTDLLGYEVALNKERAGYKVYNFKSEKKYENESNKQIVSHNMLAYTKRIEDSSIAINYTIGSKTERERLLTAFELEGYDYVKATKTESVYDNAATIYKSDKHPDIRLKVTNYEKGKKAAKRMEYDFELLRMVKAPEEEKNKDPLRVTR